MTHWAGTNLRSEFLHDSITSLIDTTRHLPVEIIVGDNGGSSSDSAKLLQLVEEGKIQHYFRNAKNLYFGWTRNIGAAMASGTYLVFTDNDIRFKPGWLEQCIGILEAFPDKKIMATPLRADPQHRNVKCWQGALSFKGVDYPMNMRAGSNCWVMRAKDFAEIGVFQNHYIAGSKWNDTFSRKGYLMVTSEKIPLAEDIGFKRGYDFKLNAEIAKVLANGEKIILNN